MTVPSVTPSAPTARPSHAAGPDQGRLARRLRRYAGGAALILFPGLLVPQALIDPAAGGTGDVMFRAATEHRAALTASALLLLVSALFMLPAAVAILHQARDRGAALANVGGVLAVLGGFGHAAIAMFYLFAVPLPDGDRTEMIAYVERLNASAAVGGVVFPLILCFGLSLLALAWAAWRAGVVGWWGPVLVTVAFLLAELLPITSAPIQATALVAVTAVFGAIGVRVLRLSDAEWIGVRA